MAKKSPSSAKAAKAKKSNPTAKTIPKTAVKSVAPRQLKTPTYRAFRLQKKISKPQTVKIPGSFKILRKSFKVLTDNWKLFLGITVVYAILNLILVQGFFGGDLATTKANAENAITGQWSKLAGGISGLSYLFGNAGNTPETGVFRFALVVIGSLAVIWALRQVLAGQKQRIRDSFYSGMYPLIPFILILIVISLEIAPLALGMYLFNLTGATNGVEITLWALILGLLSALTLYLLSSSIFALYIVCLPNMPPVKALRTAVSLVRHRRFFVLRRLLFYPLFVTITVALVMVPLIIFLTPLAVAVFFVILMLILPLSHSYVYSVYRELLYDEQD
jgi:hypothetical protein